MTLLRLELPPPSWLATLGRFFVSALGVLALVAFLLGAFFLGILAARRTEPQEPAQGCAR
jgi:hypothetical protein